MDIQAIIADLADNGTLDRLAEQTGARAFQIGDAACGALQLAHSGLSIDKTLATAMADAGISPRIAASLHMLLRPLLQKHVPVPDIIAAARGSDA